MRQNYWVTNTSIYSDVNGFYTHARKTDRIEKRLRWVFFSSRFQKFKFPIFTRPKPLFRKTGLNCIESCKLNPKKFLQVVWLSGQSICLVLLIVVCMQVMAGCPLSLGSLSRSKDENILWCKSRRQSGVHFQHLDVIFTTSWMRSIRMRFFFFKTQRIAGYSRWRAVYPHFS